MPTWLKVILILIVVGIVGAGVVVYLGIRWARREITELQKTGPEVVKEAQDFGRGKDGDACVAESLVRLGSCDSLVCDVKVRVFLTNCLSTATVAPELCANVPKQDEIIKSATWAQEECQRRGAKDMQRCARVISAIQEHCTRH